MNNRDEATPSSGGKWAIVLFVIALLAFVTESELSQHVQTTLGFRHPYFLFYIVHSSFLIIFPVHLLYLMWATKSSAHSLLIGLSHAITQHLSPSSSHQAPFPRRKFLYLVLALTGALSLPALLWFVAVTLASISDVTAIWNTNAFFAYLITVKVFRLKWEPLRLVAVSIATLGVVAVVYGGSTVSQPDKSLLETASPANYSTQTRPAAPLIGDLLTLVASVSAGLYQVMYKKYVALPNDPEVASEGLYSAVPASEDPQASVGLEGSDVPDMVYPPPFGFHPNLLTSAIGLCTFAILWIPLPILHHFGIEPFSLPSNGTTVLAIAGIALGGVVFNAGFMILLGVWGPIITSVGNLLTIVLVFLSDVLIGRGAEAVTVWSLVGSGAIISAFGVLAYDMFNR